jgi:DinB superfamily
LHSAGFDSLEKAHRAAFVSGGVSTRNEQLAILVETQSRKTIEFLSGLSDADLNTSCADPGGATVGAVVAHLGAGYDQVLGWIEKVAWGAATPAAGGHRHDHGPVDLRAQIELLRRGGADWAALLRRFGDEQLDRVPPATEGITDGSKSLAEIMRMMLDHQAIHVNYIRQAVTGTTAAAQPAT